MIKKAKYSEIIFGKEYYIGGVDIFSESPFRTYLGKVIMQLPVKVSYGLIEHAHLYLFKLKRRKFRLAIKEISDDVHIVLYFSERSLRIVGRTKDDDDNKRNDEILRQSVFKNLNDYYVPDKYTIYTRDFKRRFVFTVDDGCVKVWEENFYISEDATIDFPPNLSRPYSEAGYYLRSGGRLSYYASLEDAVKDITKQL